eukprot:1159836-Pelagomonas_calceolata.AAC.2
MEAARILLEFSAGLKMPTLQEHPQMTMQFLLRGAERTRAQQRNMPVSGKGWSGILFQKGFLSTLQLFSAEYELSTDHDMRTSYRALDASFSSSSGSSGTNELFVGGKLAGCMDVSDAYLSFTRARLGWVAGTPCGSIGAPPSRAPFLLRINTSFSAPPETWFMAKVAAKTSRWLRRYVQTGQIVLFCNALSAPVRARMRMCVRMCIYV